MIWTVYDDKAVQEKIRRCREEKGLTQSAFARMVGCSSHTISNLERGKYPITPTMIAKLCRALGWPLSEFLDKKQQAKE